HRKLPDLPSPRHAPKPAAPPLRTPTSNSLIKAADQRGRFDQGGITTGVLRHLVEPAARLSMAPSCGPPTAGSSAGLMSHGKPVLRHPCGGRRPVTAAKEGSSIQGRSRL